jgi:hypothetical protein
MGRGHIVISGTGRAGTTFLVQLLTQLGLDTGFDRETMAANIYPTARAGLEIRTLGPNAPFIVKSPFLCDDAEQLLASSVRIEHVIIPVRQFAAAAASREQVQRLVTGRSDGQGVPGGLWDTDKAAAQVDVLRFKFTKLIEALVRHDIPMTFLAYPQLVRDAEYLYIKLKFLFSDSNIGFGCFRAAFDKIVRPEWTHQFSEDDCLRSERPPYRG